MEKREEIIKGEGTADIHSEEAKTSLEFEIAEADTPDIQISTDISPEIEIAEEKAVKESEIEFPKEEFSIPSDFDPDEGEIDFSEYDDETIVEPLAHIRQTYMPRFTDVSDTYRMQDDPRPRPDAPKQSLTVVEKSVDEIDEDNDHEATTERVEDDGIEKVIVTSSATSSNEPVDESITVLKFSTPVESEIQDAFAIAPEIPKFEFNPEPVDEEVEEEEVVEVVEEVEEPNLEIPDPDATYKVVNFVNDANGYEDEEPLGSSQPLENASKAPNAEFVSPIQRDTIKDRFLDSLMSVRVRLIAVAFLFATLVGIDIFSYSGVDVFVNLGLGGIPSAKPFTDLMFAVCMFLLAIPEVIKGMKSVFKGKCLPELFIVISLLIIIANDVVLIVNNVSNCITSGVLYGVLCTCAIMASYIKAQADFSGFKIVSRNVAKNVIDRRLTRELRRENMALDGAVDEYNSVTSRMFRTAFVSGFFKRSADSAENHANVLTILCVSGGISLVTGFVTLLINDFSFVYGLQALTIVFLLSVPAVSVLAHKIPYKHASKAAEREDGAFVGENSIYEGADINVFTYEDTEIFGTEDVTLRKVHLYGKVYNTPKAMKQMYSLFCEVGGPLDYVFSSALDRKCPAATDIVIEDDGISGISEGHQIYAGTEEYMRRHGIAIPEDDYRTNTAPGDSTKVMYGAEDGEVYVKFFIRYSFSEEFTMLLPDLKAKQITPLVYTRDPNITGELIKVLTLGEDIIRVMKKYVPRVSEEKTYRHIDSGIVTHGDKNNAINMVLMAKKYVSLQSSLALIELIVSIVGAVLAVCVSIGEVSMPTSLLAVWQVIWCLLLTFRSKFVLDRVKPEIMEEENY